MESNTNDNGDIVIGIDTNELLKRLVKYLVEGGAVAVVAHMLPKKKLSGSNVVVLGLTAAAVFAILDTFSPSISVAARKGAGYGIGSGLVGGIRMA